MPSPMIPISPLASRTNRRGNGRTVTINPHAWMTDTLTKLANSHPANSVGELMPWIAVA
jgi:hypothetical protein